MFSLSGLLAGFRKGSARQSSVRSLQSLSAAELRDIGIAPDQIGDVVDAMLDLKWERPAKSRSTPPRTGYAPQIRAAVAGCG